MTRNKLIAATAFLLTPIICSTGWTTAMASNSSNASCKIRSSKDNSGVHVDAVITASGPIVGTYTFKVMSSDGSTRHAFKKSDFSVDSQAKSQLFETGVDLPAGSGYQASLEVEWPEGYSSCSSSIS